MEQQIKEFLITYTDYLVKLKDACALISDHFRSENVAEALKLVTDFSNGLSWVAEGYEALKNHGIDGQFDVGALEAFLTEINDGLTLRDYVLVADIFEYELEEFVGNYLAEVQKYI